MTMTSSTSLSLPKIAGVMINKAWLNSFPNSEATFLPPGISDHSPGYVMIRPKYFWPSAFQVL